MDHADQHTAPCVDEQMQQTHSTVAREPTLKRGRAPRSPNGQAKTKANKTGVLGRGNYQRALKGLPPTAEHARSLRVREAFLDNIRLGYSVSKAAKIAGTDPGTMYRWRAVNAEFGERWDAATEEGLDEVEDRILDASEFDWRAGVRILEAKRPAVWSPKKGGDTTVNVNTAVVAQDGGTLTETKQRIAELEQKLLGAPAPQPIDDELPGMTSEAVVIEGEAVEIHPAASAADVPSEISGSFRGDLADMAMALQARVNELIAIGRTREVACAIAEAEFAARSG